VTFPANAAMNKKKGKPAPTKSHHCPNNGGFCVSSGRRTIPLTGTRLNAFKQTEYEWISLFGGANPLTGASSALLATTVIISSTIESSLGQD